MPSPNENEEENVAKFPDDEVEAPDTTQEQSVEIEQDDSEPVSITDFADVLGKNLVTKTDKPEAKEPEKKEEEKAELKEEPDQPDEEETLPLPGSEIEEQPVAKVATKTKVARDYSGIEDSDKPLFEKMGNETFAAMKKTYLEAREIKQKLAEIEKQIAEYGNKAREGKLSIEELTGGTFSISNGGVFGSMLSTPIINPPQSAILGIHATKERAVVEDGQIVIRPINYLALSYDHRIIDGREAVLGLVAMKELLEDPARLLLDL